MIKKITIKYILLTISLLLIYSLLNKSVKHNINNNITKIELLFDNEIKYDSVSISFLPLEVKFANIRIGRYANTNINNLKLKININPFYDNFFKISTIKINTMNIKDRKFEQYIFTKLLYSKSNSLLKSKEGKSNYLIADNLQITLKKVNFKSTKYKTQLVLKDSQISYFKKIKLLKYKLGELHLGNSLHLSNLISSLKVNTGIVALSIIKKDQKNQLWSIKSNINLERKHLNLKYNIYTLPKYFSSYLTKRYNTDLKLNSTGSLNLYYKNNNYIQYELVSNLKNMGVKNTLLSSTPLENINLNIDSKGQINYNKLNINEFSISNLKINLTSPRTNNIIVLNNRINLKKTNNNYELLISTNLQKTKCSTFYNIFRDNIFKNNNSFLIKGNIRTSATLEAQLINNKNQVDVNFYNNAFTCKVVKAHKKLVNALTNQNTLHQTIYNAQKNLLANVNTLETTTLTLQNSASFIKINSLAKYIKQAFVIAEDYRFYQHNGISFKSLQNALGKNLNSSKLVLGGSTITMQTAKNLFLSNKKTLKRKLNELIYSLFIEQTLSKDEILEVYINLIEFAPAVYGLNSAAQHFFAKNAHQLSPKEISYLVTLLPSPRTKYKYFCNNYIPRSVTHAANSILKKMFKKKLFSKNILDNNINSNIYFSTKYRSNKICTQFTSKKSLLGLSSIR